MNIHLMVQYMVHLSLFLVPSNEGFLFFAQIFCYFSFQIIQSHIVLHSNFNRSLIYKYDKKKILLKHQSFLDHNEEPFDHVNNSFLMLYLQLFKVFVYYQILFIFYVDDQINYPAPNIQLLERINYNSFNTRPYIILYQDVLNY